jgi:tetratricopeptide (TPR) repeat protein
MRVSTDWLSLDSPQRRGVWWAIAALLFALQATAALADDTEAAKQAAAANAKYACPAGNDMESASKAAELSKKTYDKNALACAMDLRATVARAHPTDKEANIAALSATLAYFEHLRDLRAYELLEPNKLEYELRYGHAVPLQNEILERAQKNWPNDPVVLAYAAMLNVLGPGRRDATHLSHSLDALNRSIASDPKAIDGGASVALGRLYFELPPLLGGKPNAAIPLLEQSVTMDPREPRRIRFLAEAYLDKGDHARAVKLLNQLAGVPSQGTDLQILADEWRFGEGLSTQLENPALAKRFVDIRGQLLKAHPELLSRASPEEWMHGGNNPLTNQPQYGNEPQAGRR